MAVDALEFVQAGDVVALEGHRDLFQDGEVVRIAEGQRRAAIAHGKSIAEQTQPPALALEGPRFERSQVAEVPSAGAAGLPGQLHDGVVDDGRALAEFLVGEVGGVQHDAGRRVDNPDRALPTEPRGLQERAVTERLEPLGEGVSVVREPVQHLHAPPRRSIGVERVEPPRPSLRCQDRFDACECRLVVA